MNLLLVRHGEALSKAEAKVAFDNDRPLSPAGIKTITALGKRWKSEGLHPRRVLTSPARRALQTADLLAQALGATAEITDALALGRDPEAFLDFLQRQPNTRTLIGVGHQPQLVEIATQLAFGRVSGGMALQPGGACWVELPGFPASLAGTIRGLWNPQG